MPVRNDGGTLPAAIAAVLAQSPGVDEVLVAVAPSTDDTAAVARRLECELEQVRVVANPGGQIPDGLNIAIAAAAGEVLVRVDAKAVLPSGYVGAALEALRRTGAANVGGRQVPTAETGFARAAAAAMRSPLGAGGAAYRRGRSAGPVDTVYLGVFRREALEDVGGFDPTFLRNEDAELNLRLRAAGYLVWLEPSLGVAYRPRSSPLALARQYFDYGRWRRLTARRHPGSLRGRQLAAPAVVTTLLGATVAGVGLRRALPPLLAVAGYALVLASGATTAAERRADVPRVVVALATMHLSWGVGFLVGPPRYARTAPASSPARDV